MHIWSPPCLETELKGATASDFEELFPEQPPCFQGRKTQPQGTRAPRPLGRVLMRCGLEAPSLSLPIPPGPNRCQLLPLVDSQQEARIYSFPSGLSITPHTSSLTPRVLRHPPVSPSGCPRLSPRPSHKPLSESLSPAYRGRASLLGPLAFGIPTGAPPSAAAPALTSWERAPCTPQCVSCSGLWSGA